MKTLHLNLKKKWFDMILSGEKKEEYREIKPFFIKILLQCHKDISKNYTRGECKKAYCGSCLKAGGGRFVKLDTITFSNGYAKDRRQFEIKLESICIGTGFIGWGADKDKQYFVLNLGDIVRSNCS